MSYERSIVDDCYCIIDRLWGQTIEPSLCTRYRCGTVHVRHSPLPNVAGTLPTERVRARPSVEAIPNTTRRDSAIRRRHESEQAGVVHSGSTGCYTLRKVETSEVGRLESIPREDTYPSKPMFFILLGQPKTWGIPTHPGRFSPVDDPSRRVARFTKYQYSLQNIGGLYWTVDGAWPRRRSRRRAATGTRGPATKRERIP